MKISKLIASGAGLVLLSWQGVQGKEAKERMFIFLSCGVMQGNVSHKEIWNPEIQVKQMKELGATDIVFDDVRESLAHPTAVPGALYRGPADRDPLKELLEEAGKYDLDVWSMWGFREINYFFGNQQNPVWESRKQMWAKDGRGVPYNPWPNMPNSGIIDVISAPTRKYYKAIIDELAAKYGRYENFKGIFFDELWHATEPDKFEDDIELFKDFCRKRFGEAPPEDLDLRPKFSEGARWLEPKNKWWRRYCVFRREMVYDFHKDLYDHAYKKSLRVLNQPLYVLETWFAGYNHKQVRLGNGVLTYVGYRDGNPLFVYDDFIPTYQPYHRTGTKEKAESVTGDALMRILTIRGFPTGVYDFDVLWLVEHPEEMVRIAGEKARAWLKKYAPPEEQRGKIRFITSRSKRWQGAKSLAGICVLGSLDNLYLNFSDPCTTYNNTTHLLFAKLAHLQPVDVKDIGATDYYGRYKILIVPGYCTRGLSREVFDRIVGYVKNGGTVVSLNADWTVSEKGDLTDEVTVNEKILGIKHLDKQTDTSVITFQEASPILAGMSLELYSGLEKEAAVVNPKVAVLASTKSGAPVITEFPLGKGRVLGIHCDLKTDLDCEDPAQGAVTRTFQMLLGRYYTPLLASDGNLMVYSALEKEGAVLVSFYEESGLARNGKVNLFSGKLGLKAEYRIYQDIAKKEVLNKNGEPVWKTKDLEDPVPVTLDEQGYEFVIVEPGK